MEKLRRQRSLSWPKTLYILAVFALLLRYMILPFSFTEPYYAQKGLLIIQFAVSVSGIILGKMWKDRVFWLLAVYCVLILIRVLFVTSVQVLWDSVVSQIFFHGLWAVGACFSVASILDRHQLKNFLRFFAAVWTILAVLHCLIALYAAWIGEDIWNIPRGAFWGLSAGEGAGGPGFAERNAVGTGVNVRLNVIFYCTVSGAIMSLSAMISLCAAICEKRKALKIFYYLALVPFAFVMGLTDTRACHISFAAGAGAVAGILTLRTLTKRDRRVNPQKAAGRASGAGRWGIAVVTAVAAAGVLVLCIGSTTMLFNSMKARGNLIIANAMAEETPAATVVSARGYSGTLNSVLSNRVYIWEYITKYLILNPKTMLWGESISNPMTGPNSQGVSFEAGHPHNALLMVLLESGIPGLLLILAAMLVTVRRSFRLVNQTDTPLWLGLLPAIVLSVWVGDSVECIAGFLGYPYPNCSILFLSIGIICLYGQTPGHATVSRESVEKGKIA